MWILISWLPQKPADQDPHCSHRGYVSRFRFSMTRVKAHHLIKHCITSIRRKSAKMYPHTKFGILTSNKWRYDSDTIFRNQRPEVKVTVTRKLYATFHGQKMYPQTKFGIPTSNNIGDLLRTLFFSNRCQGHSQ